MQQDCVSLAYQRIQVVSCCLLCQEQELKRFQNSHQESKQQLEGQNEWWRGQVDDLKAQLRGEATRVLELQKKAYNAKIAQEAATQVCTCAVYADVHVYVHVPADTAQCTC